MFRQSSGSESSSRTSDFLPTSLWVNLALHVRAPTGGAKVRWSKVKIVLSRWANFRCGWERGGTFIEDAGS